MAVEESQPNLDGDLLLKAYVNGIFPMADPEFGVVDWFKPSLRGVLPLEGVHVSTSLARRVRSGRFKITVDHCFEQVMRECAVPRSAENGSWMVEPLLQAYVELFERGFAHSIEAWRDGALVGGLYGVHIGSAFFGESMFSRPALGGTDSSKVCLVHLVDRLRTSGFLLLDTQLVNDHIARLGGIEIDSAEYDRRLQIALSRTAEFPCD